jgi:hypothetical protein
MLPSGAHAGSTAYSPTKGVGDDRITHLPMVRRDPFGNSTSRTNAPDVQFVWQRALNEVEERRVGGPKRKVAV